MRLVSAFLFVALTGSGALADEPKPADPKPEVTRHKVPFRVVKMLPETGQVLLLDRDRGTHVVAEVGQTIDGYRVDDLDDETVTLVAETGTQIILAAPPPRLAHRPKAHTPAAGDVADDAAPTSSAPSESLRDADGPGMPVDPYAEPAPPLRPGEGGVRVASAAAPATALVTEDPYADPGIAAFADAVGATPAPAGTSTATATVAPAPSTSTVTTSPATATTSPASTATSPSATATSPATAASSAGPADGTGAALASALTGSPAPSSTAAAPPAPVAPPPPDLDALDLDEPTAPSTAAAPTPPTATAPATATLARAELDAALADFSTLAASFKATFTPAGLRFDSLREGTLLTRIGLRKDDVITSIDGQPLRSLDDAANLYARASSLRATTIQVTRAGKPVTLRVAIR